jgi:hypothetical protein
MRNAKGAMMNAVSLAKETNARRTESMRCMMASERRMTDSDRYVTSIVRGMTDPGPSLTDTIACENGPKLPMLQPNRQLTGAMRPAMSPVRAVKGSRVLMRRAMRPRLTAMRLQTPASAGMKRPTGAVMSPIE